MKLMTLVLTAFFSLSIFAFECQIAKVADTSILMNFESVVEHTISIDKAKKVIRKTMQNYTEDFGMSFKRAHRLFLEHNGTIDTVEIDNELYYMAIVNPGPSQFGQLYHAKDLRVVAMIEDDLFTNCQD